MDMGVQGCGGRPARNPELLVWGWRARGALSMNTGVQGRPARPGCRGTPAWGTRAASVGLPHGIRGCPRDPGPAPGNPWGCLCPPPGLTRLPGSRPAGQAAAGGRSLGRPRRRAPPLPRAPHLTSAADRRRRGHGELRRRQRQRPRPGPAARPLPMGCGAAGHGAVRGPPSPG